MMMKDRNQSLDGCAARASGIGGGCEGLFIIRSMITEVDELFDVDFRGPPLFAGNVKPDRQRAVSAGAIAFQ